jgi:hypothetical protein
LGGAERVDAFLIPAGGSAQSVDRPALMMDAAVSAAYGQPIRTLDDLEDFFSWAAAEFPNQTPCVFPIGLGAHEGYADEVFALLAPEYGYFPVDSYIGAAVGYLAPIDADESTLSFIPGERLESYPNMLSRILTWRNNKWMELIRAYGDEKAAKGYSSALVSTAAFTDGTMADRLSACGIKSEEDTAVHILYPDTLPEMRAIDFVLPASFSLIGSGTSDSGAAEYLRFLEWAHANEENTALIRYGRQGIEYELTDITVQPLYPDGLTLADGSPISYSAYFSQLYFFSDGQPLLSPFASARAAYEDAISKISPRSCAQAALLSQSVAAGLTQIRTTLNRPGAVYDRMSIVAVMHYKLKTAAANGVDAFVQQFIERGQATKNSVDAFLTEISAADGTNG